MRFEEIETTGSVVLPGFVYLGEKKRNSSSRIRITYLRSFFQFQKYANATKDVSDRISERVRFYFVFYEKSVSSRFKNCNGDYKNNLLFFEAGSG